MERGNLSVRAQASQRLLVCCVLSAQNFRYSATIPLVRSRSPAGHRRARKHRSIARSWLSNPDLCTHQRLEWCIAKPEPHHGSTVPVRARAVMSGSGKTWLCGNCLYSHQPGTKTCCWCGDRKQLPTGIPRNLAEGSWPSRFAALASKSCLLHLRQPLQLLRKPMLRLRNRSHQPKPRRSRRGKVLPNCCL